MGSNSSAEGSPEVEDQIMISQKKWASAPPASKDEAVPSPTHQEADATNLEGMLPASDEGYAEWLKEMEKKNLELCEAAKSDYSMKAEKLVEKYRYMQNEPICDMARREVQTCYLNNRKQPLNCANTVKYFNSCLQEALLNFRKEDTLPKESAR